jgi:hypothetical protein
VDGTPSVESQLLELFTESRGVVGALELAAAELDQIAAAIEVSYYGREEASMALLRLSKRIKIIGELASR